MQTPVAPAAPTQLLPTPEQTRAAPVPPGTGPQQPPASQTLPGQHAFPATPHLPVGAGAEPPAPPPPPPPPSPPKPGRGPSVAEVISGDGQPDSMAAITAA